MMEEESKKIESIKEHSLKVIGELNKKLTDVNHDFQESIEKKNRHLRETETALNTVLDENKIFKISEIKLKKLLHDDENEKIQLKKSFNIEREIIEKKLFDTEMLLKYNEKTNLEETSSLVKKSKIMEEEKNKIQLISCEEKLKFLEEINILKNNLQVIFFPFPFPFDIFFSFVLLLAYRGGDLERGRLRATGSY